MSWLAAATVHSPSCFNQNVYVVDVSDSSLVMSMAVHIFHAVSLDVRAGDNAQEYNMVWFSYCWIAGRMSIVHRLPTSGIMGHSALVVAAVATVAVAAAVNM